MRTAFDAYGELGTLPRTLTEKSGRYNFQADSERLIVHDIEEKLALDRHHSLLEIGCGVGNILISLADRVCGCVGMDHANLVGIARSRAGDRHIKFIEGRFPDTKINGMFDRVVVYSVLHYLVDFYAALDFINAAADLLNPGGMMLLGDLPNSDRKQYFLSTEDGQRQQADWLEKCEGENTSSPLSGIGVLGSFNDEMIIAIWNTLKHRGFDATPKKQNPELPFGNTREDIIVTRVRQ